jgi:hypothetical protein
MKEKTPYQRKLVHPDWQMKRLELFKARGLRCEDCSSKGKELHIHHIYYLPNTEPQNYPDDAYRVLCYDCHQIEEDRLKEIGETIMSRLRRCGADAFSIDHLIDRLEKYSKSFSLANNCVYDIAEVIGVISNCDKETQESISAFFWEIQQSQIEAYRKQVEKEKENGKKD